MIISNCIKCGQKIKIEVDGISLEDYNYATLDCPDCGKTLIILEGVLKDFNEYLKGNYESMGVEIKDNVDYTKTFVEV